MGSSAKSVTGVAIEAGSSGMQQLLNPTLVSALPASLSNAIPGAAVTGMRLVIMVWNHSAPGTIAVAGTAPNTGAAINETSISLALAEVPGDPVIYCTTNVFASVGALGVTLGSGLTGGTIMIFGVQAAKRLIVGEGKLNDKTGEHSPKEQRGSLDENFNLLALKNTPEWEFKQDYYPSDGLWIPQGAYSNSQTVTTFPASPTVLLASTSVATSGTASLTTQPSAPAMVLVITLGGTAPATAASVSVSGIDEYGEAITEIVVPTTKTQGVYYSTNRFTSVNAAGVAFGAFGTGATITVGGVFGFKGAGSPGDTLASFAMENYDSTGSFCAPYCLIDEWEMSAGLDKEMSVSVKGPAQQVFPIGDPSVATNQATAFAQVIDRPITGWRTLAYIDNIGGTPATTLQPDLIDWKVGVKINWAAKYTSWSPMPNRTWNRAYRNRRAITVECTFDMTSTTYQAEYQAWKRRQTRYLALQARGRLLGVDSGITYYEGCQWILPIKWQDVPERDYSTGKESVELKLKGTAYFSPALGYSHQYTWYSAQNGW